MRSPEHDVKDEAIGRVAIAAAPRGHGVSLGEAFWVWLRVAALSFGGPAGQIAVMHRILVEEKRWIGEARFLHALNYCMLLPGPEAQQLAIYIGWLLHRTRGGLVAGTLFVLPGFVAIMALSLIYAAFGSVGIVQALFFGLKAAVLAIVLEAVLRIGKRALKNRVLIGLAAARTMSGNGASRKKIATKAAAASPIRTRFLSARLPIRTTASSTMASTAAFSPKKRAETKPILP